VGSPYHNSGSMALARPVRMGSVGGLRPKTARGFTPKSLRVDRHPKIRTGADDEVDERSVPEARTSRPE